MIKYTVSYRDPARHFIDIELLIDKVEEKTVQLQLPSWRPGRYELGNFAKNIQAFDVYNEKGKALPFEKLNKDSWLVQTKGAKKISVKYNYYAAELNGGSTFLDAEQLYVNPVNCFIYAVGKEQEKISLHLKLPASYQVACGMKKVKGNSFELKNFDELADSPFIASKSLKHHAFTEGGVKFHLWFQGECKPDWKKLEGDFRKFIQVQLKMMKDLPVKEFHFLMHALPFRTYHGVEHLTSTVIVLGPSYNLMKGDIYKDLLGVSSHELFHVWNIKTIRPTEMMPYDFTKENYAKTGYVYEGVTTYYGDLFLLRSGVFTEEDYAKELSKTFQRHFDNYGRLNLSVADSSFDTWLDGYVMGIPERKTSIYNEGSLLSFMLDVSIRKATGNKKSLDDVLRKLYTNFGKKGKGYSEEDYKSTIEKVAGTSFDAFFKNYIWGTKSVEAELKALLNYIGCELGVKDNPIYYEKNYGFKLWDGTNKVKQVAPGSLAEQAGLSVGDIIKAINDYPVTNNLNDWCEYFENEEVILRAESIHQKVRKVSLKKTKKNYYPIYTFQQLKKMNASQQKAYRSWSK